MNRGGIIRYNDIVLILFNNSINNFVDRSVEFFDQKFILIDF